MASPAMMTDAPADTNTTAAMPMPAVPTGSVSKVPVSAAQAQALREEALAFLQSLLNKNLLVHTTDGRMFRGEFKCTDPDHNLVLAHATEYRQPTPQQRAQHAARLAASGAGGDKLTMDMTSRYLGLIVTPGKHIVKIELEEFASQLRRAR